MASLEQLSDRGPPQGLPKPPPSIKRTIYSACQCLFIAGTVLRIALEHHWHSVGPHVADAVTGHIYALSGRGAPVFVTPIEAQVLHGLEILPGVFLVVGMLVWARAWREWT